MKFVFTAAGMASTLAMLIFMFRYLSIIKFWDTNLFNNRDDLNQNDAFQLTYHLAMENAGIEFEKFTTSYFVTYVFCVIRMILFGVDSSPMISHCFYFLKDSLTIIKKNNKLILFLVGCCIIMGVYAYILYGCTIEVYSDIWRALFMSLMLLVSDISFIY